MHDRQDRNVYYREYTIAYRPPPIPWRSDDWSYSHKDYDGAEDAKDYRCGTSDSIEGCIKEIDQVYMEQEEGYDYDH